jgi:hypothetical protein
MGGKQLGFGDYKQTTSTIEVRQVNHSVPLRPIRREATVLLHHDRLVAFLGSHWECHLARTYGVAGEKLARRNDLELIDSLRDSALALLHCRH